MTQLTQEIIDAAPADSWIEWHGGECPVAPDARVHVRIRSGDEDTSGAVSAGGWWWGRTSCSDGGGVGEIIAYKLAKPTSSAVTAEEKQALLSPTRFATAREREQAAFEHWLESECPSGDLESIDRQWLASDDYAQFLEDEEALAADTSPVTASDRAGIASFEPPPEVAAEPEPVRVSTHGRRWAWLLGVR